MKILTKAGLLLTKKNTALLFAREKRVYNFAPKTGCLAFSLASSNRPLALRGHVTNASFKQ